MGLVNTTKTAFVKIGIFGVNVVAGYIEEITFNVTKTEAANAIDVIPKVPDSQILIKRSAYATGAALTSSVVKNKIVEIISGATFTRLI